jgi:GT2 family glycosyltransferase
MSIPAVEVTASPAPVATFAHHDAGPDVSVVVVAFGTGPILLRTLASVADAAAETPSPTVEVVVVSNPHPVRGQRSLVDLRLATAGVRVVVPSTNVGFGGGCELGALVARGDVLVFLNPDVTVPTGWLDPLVEVVRADGPRPVIAAPVLLDPDGTVQEAGQRLHRSGATSPVGQRPSEPADVDYASAACWVMTRDDHELVGGFDPRYHPAYFEDVDLAIRARALGGRCVVVPAVEVVHDRGRGTPDVAGPASEQRDLLLDRHPWIRWQQPAQPEPARTASRPPNTASTIRRA